MLGTEFRPSSAVHHIDALIEWNIEISKAGHETIMPYLNNMILHLTCTHDRKSKSNEAVERIGKTGEIGSRKETDL